jgi:hypothetical protein
MDIDMAAASKAVTAVRFSTYRDGHLNESTMSRPFNPNH